MHATIALLLCTPLAALVFVRCMLVLSKRDGWLQAIVATAPVPIAIALVLMPSGQLPFPGFSIMAVAAMTFFQVFRLIPPRPPTPIKASPTDATNAIDARR